ncbi:Zn-ribbon domain-containing OB-fold protein [Streptomyces boninensis]|uniref:Zn-ribbon domain-containing OB-fold protein n=1 Tax=Streptomyces boninensis TaxID=2039455 RepID=UPI003B21BA22
MSQDDDALYERLKTYEGQSAGEAGRGHDPVNEPMIRHWCEALGHPVPPDGSAPATMLQVWTMAGYNGPTGRSGTYLELFALLEEAGCTSIVATDCEQEYLRPLRPGDDLDFDSVIETISPRKTTKLGSGHFITTRMQLRVAGEVVGTHRFRVFKYAPAKAQKARQPAADKPRRPRPVVNRDNAGFWDGVADRRLLFQRCTGCRTARFPWLPGCNSCGSPEWTAEEAAGEGTVYSYVVMHHPRFEAFEPPYAVGLIELDEGVRMISNVVGVPYDKVRIGMPVRLEFAEVEDDLVLPVFRATGEGEAE